MVRGPGSVLYGTNAFSGVINLVTRDAGGKTSGEAGVGTSEYGAGRGRARLNLRLGEDASMWLSVAAAKGAGRDFHFPEFVPDDPALAGNARDIDGFKSATVNGRVTYKALTAMWLLNSRNKWVPTAEYETIFGDPRLQQVDTRGLVEVRFEPQVSSIRSSSCPRTTPTTTTSEALILTSTGSSATRSTAPGSASSSASCFRPLRDFGSRSGARPSSTPSCTRRSMRRA